MTTQRCTRRGYVPVTRNRSARPQAAVVSGVPSRTGREGGRDIDGSQNRHHDGVAVKRLASDRWRRARAILRRWKRKRGPNLCEVAMLVVSMMTSEAL